MKLQYTGKVEKKIGLEVESFVLDEKGNPKVVRTDIPHDDFPIFGEIRGVEGKTVAEVLANFRKAEIEFKEKLHKNETMDIAFSRKIPLAVYREAMKKGGANKSFADTRNIYNTNIEDFSDQIVNEKGKIQGILASCGLHIHFSCSVVQELKIEEEEGYYTPVDIPFTVPISNKNAKEKDELSVPLNLRLYKLEKYNKENLKDRKVEAVVSALNKPTIEYIVRSFDEKYFKKFTPAEGRTKYRQPGYYRVKPYGFEYRSLGAYTETMNILEDLVRHGFKVLEEVLEV